MPASFEDRMTEGEAAMSDDRHAQALAAFEDALRLAKAPHQRATALDRMANANYRLEEDERAFALLNEAIDITLPLAATDQAAALALARACYDKGGMMAQVGRGPAAFEPLDLLIGRFADIAGVAPRRDEDELRYMVVLAMDLKAAGLGKLDRKRDAVACYEDMIRRFAPVTDTPVEAILARAMRNRAWLLGELGRQDEEIDAHAALVARYGENHLIRVSHIIIDALTSKHQIYRDQEEFEKAIETCDDLIRRYEFDPGNGIAERVARTMIRRANYLNKLGRSEEEFAAYDTVSRMFGHFEEPDVRVHAAKALMFKAVSLNDADQSAAEIECYEEVIRRYRDDPADEVREVAADAMLYKGTSLGAIAVDAAEDTGMREIDAEIACYDEAIARYGAEEFVGLRRVVAEALLHKAEALADVGRAGEAAACLNQLIAGHEAIDDKDLQEIVQDARELRAQI